MRAGTGDPGETHHSVGAAANAPVLDAMRMGRAPGKRAKQMLSEVHGVGRLYRPGDGRLAPARRIRKEAA